MGKGHKTVNVNKTMLMPLPLLHHSQPICKSRTYLTLITFPHINNFITANINSELVLTGKTHNQVFFYIQIVIISIIIFIRFNIIIIIIFFITDITIFQPAKIQHVTGSVFT